MIDIKNIIERTKDKKEDEQLENDKLKSSLQSTACSIIGSTLPKGE